MVNKKAVQDGGKIMHSLMMDKEEGQLGRGVTYIEAKHSHDRLVWLQILYQYGVHFCKRFTPPGTQTTHGEHS